MEMRCQPNTRSMFHIDCESVRGQIMKDLNKSKPDDDGTILHAYECMGCHKVGYYGIRNKTRVIIVKEENDII